LAGVFFGRSHFRHKSYRLRLFRNDLTAEGAEGAEFEKREINHSDANGFELMPKIHKHPR